MPDPGDLMAYIRDENARLATHETILTIRPGDQDTETANTSRGPVVVRTGQYQPGDEVVYFRDGTALPLADPRYAFLAPRGVTQIHGRQFHILRAAMLLPYSLFEADVTAWLFETAHLAGQDPTQRHTGTVNGIGYALDLYRVEGKVPTAHRPRQARPPRGLAALWR